MDFAAANRWKPTHSHCSVLLLALALVVLVIIILLLVVLVVILFLVVLGVIWIRSGSYDSGRMLSTTATAEPFVYFYLRIVIYDPPDGRQTVYPAQCPRTFVCT